MDKNRLTAIVAAIITTLAECPGTTESMLYIFCDMNMDHWQLVRRVMVDGGMVKISGNFVTITDHGRTIANAVNAAIAK